MPHDPPVMSARIKVTVGYPKAAAQASAGEAQGELECTA